MNSPSKNEGRHLRKQEMRNADSPDGCVSSVASKNLEKSKGKFKSFPWNQLEKLWYETKNDVVLYYIEITLSLIKYSGSLHFRILHCSFSIKYY